MISQIQITLPNEPKENIDAVLFLLKTELGIKNMILLSAENNSLIIFRRRKNEIQEIMSGLSRIGVGVDFGIIDILPLNASIPEIASLSEKKEDSMDEKLKSRISLEEITANISEVSAFDMNYIIFITLASIVACAGLLANSPPVLIKDEKIVSLGLRGQIFGILIGILIGIVTGFFIGIFRPGFLLTSEMLTRGHPDIIDAIIAICGGIAVGFCIAGGIRSALVGIAIAVALLPPAVNSGILLILGELSLSLGSFILMLMNIILINFCAILVFKLKDIKSIPITPNDWKGPEEKISIQKKKEPINLTKFQKFKQRFAKKDKNLNK